MQCGNRFFSPLATLLKCRKRQGRELYLTKAVLLPGDSQRERKIKGVSVVCEGVMKHGTWFS